MKIYLSSENIHGKAIETTDDSLLDIQSKIIQCPHRGEQKTWSTAAKHVDIHGSSFPHPDLNLQEAANQILRFCNHTRSIWVVSSDTQE